PTTSTSDERSCFSDATRPDAGMGADAATGTLDDLLRLVPGSCSTEELVPVVVRKTTDAGTVGLGEAGGVGVTWAAWAALSGQPAAVAARASPARAAGDTRLIRSRT